MNHNQINLQTILQITALQRYLTSFKITFFSLKKFTAKILLWICTASNGHVQWYKNYTNDVFYNDLQSSSSRIESNILIRDLGSAVLTKGNMNESILIRQELLNKTKKTKYANNCYNEHEYNTKLSLSPFIWSLSHSTNV